MNSKTTTNSQLLTTKPKNKNKLSKQLEQERITDMQSRGVGGGKRGERYRD